MRGVAHSRKGHPKIRALAHSIVNHISSHDFARESEAIGEYVRRNIRYVRDANGIEQLTDPITLIDQVQSGIAQGDCDDMALLVATLLLAIGHRPYFKVVRYKEKSGGFEHIYVVDYDRNGSQARQRVVLDAILKHKPIGYEVPHGSGKEIAV